MQTITAGKFGLKIIGSSIDSIFYGSINYIPSREEYNLKSFKFGQNLVT